MSGVGLFVGVECQNSFYSLLSNATLCFHPHLLIFFLVWTGTPYRDVAHAWIPPAAGFV